MKSEIEKVMKKCQVGTRDYEEANNLHAECYGLLGKMLSIIEQLGGFDDFKTYDIPDYKLPHLLWKKGEERAKAEKVYEEYHLNKDIYLASLTNSLISEHKSHAAAERNAMITEDYKLFCKERAEAKGDLYTARAKVQAIQAEIDMRKKRAYDDNREYKAQGMN